MRVQWWCRPILIHWSDFTCSYPLKLKVMVTEVWEILRIAGAKIWLKVRFHLEGHLAVFNYLRRTCWCARWRHTCNYLQVASGRLHFKADLCTFYSVYECDTVEGGWLQLRIIPVCEGCGWHKQSYTLQKQFKSGSYFVLYLESKAIYWFI